MHWILIVALSIIFPSLLSLTAYQRIYSSKDISLGMMMLWNYILLNKNQCEYRGTKYRRGRGHYFEYFIKEILFYLSIFFLCQRYINLLLRITDHYFSPLHCFETLIICTCVLWVTYYFGDKSTGVYDGPFMGW
jgi:L-asparagine transporter-like permease